MCRRAVITPGNAVLRPSSAGVFGKLNEVRLAKGGKPMGFLNPFICEHTCPPPDPPPVLELVLIFPYLYSFNTWVEYR